MGKYQKWCFPQKVYAMYFLINFDKDSEIYYNLVIGGMLMGFRFV